VFVTEVIRPRPQGAPEFVVHVRYISYRLLDFNLFILMNNRTILPDMLITIQVHCPLQRLLLRNQMNEIRSNEVRC
jgi:hypothetical protein